MIVNDLPEYRKPHVPAFSASFAVSRSAIDPRLATAVCRCQTKCQCCTTAAVPREILSRVVRGFQRSFLGPVEFVSSARSKLRIGANIYFSSRVGEWAWRILFLVGARDEERVFFLQKDRYLRIADRNNLDRVSV